MWLTPRPSIKVELFFFPALAPEALQQNNIELKGCGEDDSHLLQRAGRWRARFPLPPCSQPFARPLHILCARAEAWCLERVAAVIQQC